MRTDPERAVLADATGLYIRAQRPDDRWDSVDIAELDRDSLVEFVLSRGPVNDWARDIIVIILGHSRDGLAPSRCEHDSAPGSCPFTACRNFGEPPVALDARDLAKNVREVLETPDYYEAKPHKAHRDIEMVRRVLDRMVPNVP
jgi:hypothetical protein